MGIKKRLLKVRKRSLVTVGLFSLIFFCLVGAPLIINGYLGYSKADEARVAVPAPFFAGFLFMGFLGLVGAVKSYRNPAKVSLGLFMVVFAYVGIELFFGLVGGDAYFGR